MAFGFDDFSGPDPVPVGPIEAAAKERIRNTPKHGKLSGPEWAMTQQEQLAVDAERKQAAYERSRARETPYAKKQRENDEQFQRELDAGRAAHAAKVAAQKAAFDQQRATELAAARAAYEQRERVKNEDALLEWHKGQKTQIPGKIA